VYNVYTDGKNRAGKILYAHIIWKNKSSNGGEGRRTHNNNNNNISPKDRHAPAACKHEIR